LVYLALNSAKADSSNEKFLSGCNLPTDAMMKSSSEKPFRDRQEFLIPRGFRKGRRSMPLGITGTFAGW